MKTKLLLIGALMFASLAGLCLALAGCVKSPPEVRETTPKTPAETRYSISVTQPAVGGVILASDMKVAAGTTIELTARVDDDYEFVGWTSRTAGVVFDDATAVKATFEMPERDVVISARFEHYSVYDAGVEIGGLIWATRNVGAKGTFTDKAEDYGELYTFEEAQEACPTGWRVPTDMELNSLAFVDSVWTTENGVNGCRFGSGENTIFLPAAGWRQNGQVSDQSYAGRYWSSRMAGSDNAFFMNLSDGYVDGGVITNRAFGLSVRCVNG